MFIVFQPKEKLMQSVDKELSKSIQRHLDSSKLSSIYRSSFMIIVCLLYVFYDVG